MGKRRNSKAQSLTPLKLTIVGSSGVGKTSLLLSYKNLRFESNNGNQFEPVALDYLKIFNLEDIDIPVVLSDSSTQREYAPLRPIAYRDTDCFIICYAVNNVKSFADVEKNWIPELKQYCKKVPYILVGTKTDTRKADEESKTVVSYEEGEARHTSIKSQAYTELSAKEMTGMEAMFLLAVRTALSHRYGNKRLSCVIS